MASQYNNSSLKQGLDWIIGLMLKFGRSLGHKGQEDTLDNSTVTSSSTNVHPNPHKQRAQLAVRQFDVGKACSNSYLCLVPLESAISALQEVFCVFKYHHCAACTYCIVAYHHCGYFSITLGLF